MSVDKRTVSTDALETLGSIIDEGEKRDAIHLAVDPAVAAHELRPGEHVGFLPGGRVGVVQEPDKPVGIVDPFLYRNVKANERFWLVVYPRKITSLRHVWTHPAFDAEPEEITDEEFSARHKEMAHQFLEEFAHNCGIDIDTLLRDAVDHVQRRDSWDHLTIRGQDAHGNIPDWFWDYVGVVADVEIPEEYRAKYFSCSC